MVHTGEIIVMKKRFKTYRFIVYADGTYQQISDNKVSDFCPDFADLFITMASAGFRQINK